MTPELRARNARILRRCLLGVAVMLGVAFASAPLYDLFCRVTGFGGTPMTAQALPTEIHPETVTVRFNTDTGNTLDWDFTVEARQHETRIGEPQLVNFNAKNRSRAPVIGMAVYNVTPPGAAVYFSKVQCFCFNEQLLKPGESMDMPVQYFIDPAILQDPDFANMRTITLSYTFYEAADPNYEKAYAAYEKRQEDLINRLR